MKDPQESTTLKSHGDRFLMPKFLFNFLKCCFCSSNMVAEKVGPKK